MIMDKFTINIQNLGSKTSFFFSISNLVIPLTLSIIKLFLLPLKNDNFNSSLENL